MEGQADKETIMIVDDIEEYLHSLRNALGREYNIFIATSIDNAKDVMSDMVGLLLLDIRLDENDPSNRDGILLLKWCKEKYPSKPVVMMSSYSDFDMAVDALNMGASYFLRKPVNISELKALLSNFLEKVRLSEEITQLKKKLSRYEDKT